MDIYFILLVITQRVIVYFLAQISPDSVIGKLYKLIAVSFQNTSIIFCAFPYLLTLEDGPGAFCIFPALPLESAIFQKILVSFSGE